jgi:hypothetical protein
MAPFGWLGIRNPEPPARCPPARIYSAPSNWLTDGLAWSPLWHRAEISAKAAHDTRYLGQPFLGRPSKLGFGTKSALDLIKIHLCPSERHGEIEEHFVTPTGLPFRASPDVLGRLNQPFVHTGLRSIGRNHLKLRLQRNRHVLEPYRGLQGTTFAFGMIVEEAGPALLCLAGQRTYCRSSASVRSKSGQCGRGIASGYFVTMAAKSSPFSPRIVLTIFLAL